MLNEQPKILFTGNGVAGVLEADAKLAARHIEVAEEDAALSAALLTESVTVAPAPVQPLYLREADVTYARAKA
jgi:hypothetical protein